MKSGIGKKMIVSTSVEDLATALQEVTSSGVQTCSAGHGEFLDL